MPSGARDATERRHLLRRQRLSELLGGGQREQARRKLHALHLEQFHNPYASRTLSHLLRAQSLSFVVTEPVAVPLTAAGALELLSRTAQKAREAKQLSESELAR